MADKLSRAYQEVNPNDTLEELEIHMVLPISPSKLKDLQRETQKDPILQRLKQVIIEGWPQRKSYLSSSIQSYWDYKEKLTIYDDPIFKRNKVVIRPGLRKEMLRSCINLTSALKRVSNGLKKPYFGQKWTKRLNS